MEEQLFIAIQESVAQNCYLDKELSLYKMAALLNTNTSYLSKVVNDRFEKRFSDFLNDCRIKYILRTLVRDPKLRTYTIEHIADISGFSSTSAFYNAFKKYTGETPAHYIKALNANQ